MRADADKRLPDYLSAVTARRWAWGECDCLIFLADWLERATGIDPAGEYRGGYDDERGARRVIQAAGGIFALVDRCAARAGLQDVLPSLVCPGDIGLVQVPLKPWRDRMINVPCGAICLRRDLWAVRTREGVSAMAFPLLRAWGLQPPVPHG